MALWITLAALLGLLAWFKYYVFVTVNVDNVFHGMGLGRPLPLLDVTLPIAISFFTFMAVSYVVDVHRGVLKRARPMDLAVFLAFFPHLVAGPIVRGTELLPQIRRRRDPQRVNYVEAFWLIAAGLAKKVVLSSYLATYVVDPVFASPRQHSGAEVIVAVWGYAVQIYADFSGYTDIAIGIALLLGFRFPQNFDRPYTAVSLQDFWRRWHMTLSVWLRDYLYIPLGGNRGPEWRISVEHHDHHAARAGCGTGRPGPSSAGAAYHGIGQVIGRQRRRWRAAHGLPLEPGGRARVALARFVTFQVVCVRVAAVPGHLVLQCLGHAEPALLRVEPSPLITPLALAAIAVGIATQYLPDGCSTG